MLDGWRMVTMQRSRTGGGWEVLLGRGMAACAHPLAAWRSRTSSFRVLLLAGYFAAGYLGVLAALLFAQ